MKLPTALYNAVKSTMGNHGDWHDARLPRTRIPYDRRPSWDVMRENVRKHHYEQYGDILVSLTEPGAGRQFLEFHRMMMRHFKWLVQKTEGHNFQLKPWNGIPSCLRASANNPFGFSALYVDEQQARTEFLIKNGTDEELGNFLESSGEENTFGSDVHNLCHGAVGAYEYARPNIDASGAEMENFGTAHYNEEFWNLHAWLDDIYARWQVQNGIVPDQSPIDPVHHHMGATTTPVPHAAHGHGSEDSLESEAMRRLKYRANPSREPSRGH